MFFLLNVPQYIGWLVFNEQYMGLFLGLALCARPLSLIPARPSVVPQCVPWYDIACAALAGFAVGLYIFIFYPVHRQFAGRYLHRAGDSWLRHDSLARRSVAPAGRLAAGHHRRLFSVLRAVRLYLSRAISTAKAGRSAGSRPIFISMPTASSARRCRWAPASSSFSSSSAKCSTSSAAPSS